MRTFVRHNALSLFFGMIFRGQPGRALVRRMAPVQRPPGRRAPRRHQLECVRRLQRLRCRRGRELAERVPAVLVLPDGHRVGSCRRARPSRRSSTRPDASPTRTRRWAGTPWTDLRRGPGLVVGARASTPPRWHSSWDRSSWRPGWFSPLPAGLRSTRPASDSSGSGVLGRLPHQRGLLGTHTAELAERVPGRRRHGGALHLPSAARVLAEQTGRRAHESTGVEG